VKHSQLNIKNSKIQNVNLRCG